MKYLVIVLVFALAFAGAVKPVEDHTVGHTEYTARETSSDHHNEVGHTESATLMLPMLRSTTQLPRSRPLMLQRSALEHSRLS